MTGLETPRRARNRLRSNANKKLFRGRMERKMVVLCNAWRSRVLVAKGGSFCLEGANTKRQNAELRKGAESDSAFDLEPSQRRLNIL
jgi:hypothetical protein